MGVPLNEPSENVRLSPRKGKFTWEKDTEIIETGS